MNILEIFGTQYTRTSVLPLLSSQINKLSVECSQFLDESCDQPVYKNINKNRTFTKFKARAKKNTDTFSEAFNGMFVPKLRQRAIYAHGIPQLCEGLEHSYYIFPKNGFQYVYNTQIQDSSVYEHVFNSVDSVSIFNELIQHNYTNNNLNEGIQSGAEILFHNIPYCYAVNVKSFDSYRELLSII